MQLNPLANDLNYILKHTVPLWEQWRNQRIFITGGTGFFGCWLLESFVWANQKLNLDAHAVILTRNINSFKKKCPHLVTQSSLHFHEGDVRDFEFSKEEFSDVIHAATDASAQLNETNPLLMLDTIVEGTRHTLEFAKHCKAKRFLLASSGAVYGTQPSSISHLTETYPCRLALHDTKSAYAMGKSMAEHMCYLYAKQFGLQVKIARCFAFIGPYLPLDIHFAIGNFIRDGLKSGPIVVNGDGTPYRSYLYAADLVIWLLHVLFAGKIAKPYHVGSADAISIAELAHLVAENFSPARPVHICAPPSDKLPARYVPDVRLAMEEFALPQPIKLSDAIARTIAWHRNRVFAQKEGC